MYINPVFSKKQEWILTGDKYEDEDGSEVAWSVLFYDGSVDGFYIVDDRYVRPVRSVE